MALSLTKEDVIVIKDDLADKVDLILVTAARMEEIVQLMQGEEAQKDETILEKLTDEYTHLKNNILAPQQQAATEVYRYFQVGTGQPIAEDGEISIKPESPIIDFPTAPLRSTLLAEMKKMLANGDLALEVTKRMPKSLLRAIGDNFVKLLETDYAEHMALAICFDMGKTYEDAKKELAKGVFIKGAGKNIAPPAIMQQILLL